MTLRKCFPFLFSDFIFGGYLRYRLSGQFSEGELITMCQLYQLPFGKISCLCNPHKPADAFSSTFFLTEAIKKPGLLFFGLKGNQNEN